MEDPKFVLIDLHAQGRIANHIAEGPVKAQKSSPCKWQASLNGKEVVLIPMKDMMIESNKEIPIKGQPETNKYLAKEDMDTGLNLYFDNDSGIQVAEHAKPSSPVGNKNEDVPVQPHVIEEAVQPDQLNAAPEETTVQTFQSHSRFQMTLAVLLVLSSAWLLSQANVIVFFN